MKLPEWTDNAVLIYGPRKGGTTLVQNLHDGGNELLVYPSELKLKYFLKTIWHAQPVASREYYEKSRVLGRELENFDNSGYEQFTQHMSERQITNLRELICSDVAGVCEYILEKPQHLKMWAAKEVGGSAKAILSLWRQMFFNGKAILILREPRMVTRSVIMDRKRKGVTLSLGKLWFQAKEPLMVLYDYLQILEDKSIHFMIYEDIVADPKKEMQKACDYLGIEYNEILESPTIFGQHVIVKTSSQQTTKVFQVKKKWQDGLSFREKVAVAFFTMLIETRLKWKKSGKRYPGYQAMSGIIRSR